MDQDNGGCIIMTDQDNGGCIIMMNQDNLQHDSESEPG